VTLTFKDIKNCKSVNDVRGSEDVVDHFLICVLGEESKYF